MVKSLLDTCVVSELRLPSADPRVIAKIESLDTEYTYISVITLGEIAKGIHLLPFGARRQEMAIWFSGFELRYGQKVLPIDADVAHIWGELEARMKSKGYNMATADGLIAATAMHHGLQIVTRNVKHFEPTGALLINPWES